MSSVKIDFCIVGPQRTGSTWLYEVLNRHDLACLPKDVKETNYFDSNYSKGDSYYSTFFQCWRSDQLKGEVATTYFDNTKCLQRIKEHNADCKIIIIYRNPVERAISLFNHQKKKRSISGNIIDAASKYPSIIEGGRYSKWIPLWEKQFGKDQVKVLNYHQLQSDPQCYIDELLDFLGIERINLKDQDQTVVNKSSSPKYPLLAKYSTACVSYLRKRGLNKIIKAGKEVGLNKVYTGGEINAINYQERAELESFFSADDYLWKATLN